MHLKAVARVCFVAFGSSLDLVYPSLILWTEYTHARLRTQLRVARPVGTDG